MVQTNLAFHAGGVPAGGGNSREDCHCTLLDLSFFCKQEDKDPVLPDPFQANGKDLVLKADLNPLHGNNKKDPVLPEQDGKADLNPLHGNDKDPSHTDNKNPFLPNGAQIDHPSHAKDKDPVLPEQDGAQFWAYGHDSNGILLKYPFVAEKLDSAVNGLNELSWKPVHDVQESVPQQPFHVTIILEDYCLLFGQGWLTDSLIDLWMLWISHDISSVHFCQAAFYTALTSFGPEGIKSLTSKRSRELTNTTTRSTNFQLGFECIGQFSMNPSLAKKITGIFKQQKGLSKMPKKGINEHKKKGIDKHKKKGIDKCYKNKKQKGLPKRPGRKLKNKRPICSSKPKSERSLRPRPETKKWSASLTKKRMHKSELATTKLTKKSKHSAKPLPEHKASKPEHRTSDFGKQEGITCAGENTRWKIMRLVGKGSLKEGILYCRACNAYYTYNPGSTMQLSCHEKVDGHKQNAAS
eukprot:jgi/Psemu1/17804/gm1.17804_g